MEDCISIGHLFDVAILVSSWVKHYCFLHLLAPGQLLLRVNLVHQFLESVGLLLGFYVRN